MSFYDDAANIFIGEFNNDIGGWDVSNVTDMSYMFYHSKFNQDISNWDVSNLTDMYSMFNIMIPFTEDWYGHRARLNMLTQEFIEDFKSLTWYRGPISLTFIGTNN